MKKFLILISLLGLPLTLSCDKISKAETMKKEISQETQDRLVSFFKSKHSSMLPANTEVKLGDFKESEAKGLTQGVFKLSIPGSQQDIPVPFLIGEDSKHIIINLAKIVNLGELEKSKINGFNEGKIDLAVNPLPILVSEDGSQLIVGEILDSSVDPRQEVISNIQFDNVPFKGEKDAKITVVEYSDFQCPYCKSASDAIPNLIEEYKGKIKLVFKQFPLPNHNWAKPASIASLCAYEQDNDKFWKYHDLIFASQRDITLANSKEKFKEFAKKSDLNEDEFNKCLSSKTIAEKVEAEINEGRGVGVNSTPTFIVDGLIIPGADMKRVRNEINSRL